MESAPRGLDPSRLIGGLKLWGASIFSAGIFLVSALADNDSAAQVSVLAAYTFFLLAGIMFSLGSSGSARACASLTTGCWLVLPLTALISDPMLGIKGLVLAALGSIVAFAGLWVCLAWRFGIPKLGSAVGLALTLPLGSALVGAVAELVSSTPGWLLGMCMLGGYATVLLLGLYLVYLIAHASTEILKLGRPSQATSPAPTPPGF